MSTKEASVVVEVEITKVSKPSNSHVSSKIRSRWITVEPILFLAYIGNGTLSTIRSEYLQHRIGIDQYNYTAASSTGNLSSMPCVANSSDPNYITQQNIQQDASNWTLILSICGYLPLLFATMAIGSWSDTAGRKIAIAISLGGMIVQSLVYVVTLACNLPLAVLIVGELSYGVTGGGPLLVAASLSYIADVTTTEQRTFRVVIAETTLLLSIGVAQLFMGYLIASSGFVSPFYLILSCQAAALIYTLIPGALYESITASKSAEKTMSTGDRIKKLVRDVIDLFAYNGNDRRWRLLLLTAMFFAIVESTYGYISVIALYAIGPPFCWSAVLVGIYMSLSLFISAIGSVAGFKIFKLWLSDIWILHITMVSTVVSFGIMGFANTTAAVFVASGIGCLRSLSTPIIRSMASKSVFTNEQGAILAFLASVESVAVLLSPAIFQPLYASGITKNLPGAPFLFAAGLGVVAAVFASILHYRFSSSSSYDVMPGIKRKPITLDNL